MARRRSASSIPTGKATKPSDAVGKSRQVGKVPVSEDFPIVGIGASAGGLEAFGQFFSHLPADSGMAFVLVQHLDPTHVSNMADLLKRYTPMPVLEVEDGTRVRVNHVYVIPPNKNIRIANRTLQLLEQPERPGLAHSIDMFFRSMADDLKERAICVILSGTGTDGTLGARAVKSEMGMVMVQEPESARYDGMPRAALASGVADIIQPPEKMADKLIEYVRQSYGKPAETRRTDLDKGSSNMQQIFALLRRRTRHDFSSYKMATVRRRIERRMSINQIEKIGDYVRLLKENNAEADALFKDFLINVTSFFRDAEAFESLKAAFCKVLSAKPDGAVVRAWAVGCSTGEEAYSLAIIIHECMESIGRHLELQLFGTDIDPDAISAARTGIYPAGIADDVSEGRLREFFVRKDNRYQVKKDIREKLVFAIQDITVDPPFSRMDLISTRNVLIYLDADMQKKLIPVFHRSLNDDGILFLGTAESVGEFVDLFSPIDRKWKVYQRRRRDGEIRPPVVAGLTGLSPRTTDDGLPGRGIGETPAEKALLAALPPAVIVDRSMNIVYVHGQTGKYLELSEGQPGRNVLEMARRYLRIELAAAIREALAQNREAVREAARVKVNGSTQRVRVVVRPVSEAGGTLDNLVVVFEDIQEPKPARAKKGAGAASEQDARSRELEQELQHTRDTLRSTIEEAETANEELRLSNEEYQSTNEELQSTNEELETSREELQSVNEELMTMNTQYQAKLEEMSSLNDDMKNLLNTTDVATVFVDMNLAVRRFTQPATRVFNLIESDVGRPLEHVTSRLKDVKVIEKVNGVLETLVPVREDVRTEDGRWYSMRVLPYRTTDNNIAGAVLSFADVTEHVELEAALRGATDYLRGIVDTVREPLIVLDGALVVVSANGSFYRTFKVRHEETEGKRVYDLGNGQWNIPALRDLLGRVLTQDAAFQDYEVEHDFPNIGKRRLILNARRLVGAGGETDRILLAIEDVTEKGGEVPGKGKQR